MDLVQPDRVDDGQDDRQEPDTVDEGKHNHQGHHLEVIFTEERILCEVEHNHRDEARHASLEHWGEHFSQGKLHALIGVLSLGVLAQIRVRHIRRHLHSESHGTGKIQQRESVQFDANDGDESIQLNRGGQQHASDEKSRQQVELEQEHGSKVEEMGGGGPLNRPASRMHLSYFNDESAPA